MFIQMIRATITNQMVLRTVTIFIAICITASATIADEHRFSDEYVMEVDPDAKKALGEQTFNEVMAFFNAAEQAIETKNLSALMALYSENYRDGVHNKQSAEQIWKRIFSKFNGMATHHNMKLVNFSEDKNMVILSCSGLLVGMPDPEQRSITVDNWTLQNHILVKEAGAWKLIGSYGKDRKRLWFDKPMHPLF